MGQNKFDEVQVKFRLKKQNKNQQSIKKQNLVYIFVFVEVITSTSTKRDIANYMVIIFLCYILHIYYNYIFFSTHSLSLFPTFCVFIISKKGIKQIKIGMIVLLLS